MAPIRVDSNCSGGGSFSKSHLKHYQPLLFTGDLKWKTVNLFLRKPLFESAFHPGFIPKVAIIAVRNEICVLNYSRGVREVVYFNKYFSQRIRMLQKGTTLMRDDLLYDQYYSTLPAAIADQIIASAYMQKNLEPDIPLMLANAIEMVGKFSICITSYLANAATPVIHFTNFSAPNAATILTPTSLEAIDLTVANTNNKYYHCNGFDHTERNCTTLDTGECRQAFHAGSGRNRSRRDGGCDRNDNRCDGLRASAPLAARSINNVQVASVDDGSMNDDVEDSEVELKVMEGEDNQGNSN
ncbi:hypothetical protein K440DRAFT_642037 [Wilcoxina mikolae CBS 423.85]|nr:hypothetical protein K440DRAFT_642037 [Wilcoxina mikolae CBS 423.85]